MQRHQMPRSSDLACLTDKECIILSESFIHTGLIRYMETLAYMVNQLLNSKEFTK